MFKNLFTIETINEVTGSILDTEDVRHFEPEDFYIVPNAVESDFAKHYSDKVYLTHNELRICFGIKPTKENLDDLLLVKKIFHPASLVNQQRKPTHLYH
jgi:hypothetical protein